MKKGVYWFLSLTWGLPMSLIGLCSALVLRICKANVHQHKHGVCVIYGHNWGGINLGCVSILCHECDDEFSKNHEYGHSIQNIIYGPLMLIIVGLPSLIRAAYRTLLVKRGKKLKTGYYDIWFEEQANYFGGRF